MQKCDFKSSLLILKLNIAKQLSECFAFTAKFGVRNYIERHFFPHFS